jgi:hypothetical protein
VSNRTPQSFEVHEASLLDSLGVGAAGPAGDAGGSRAEERRGDVPFCYRVVAKRSGQSAAARFAKAAPAASPE